MKKIYYLLALVIVAFASCKPLSKTYQDIDSAPLGDVKLTLSTTEYKSLPSTNYAFNSFNFKTINDANLSIPSILAIKYPVIADLKSASVSFAMDPTTSSIAAPDFALARIATTLVTLADHTFPTSTINGNLIPGNSVAYFTADAAINYLNYKYPTPAAYQMVVLTYNYLETGVTAAAGNTTTDTFVFLKNTWTKIYTISPAQYASVNRGSNNMFLTTDLPNIIYILNSILKEDVLLMSGTTTGTTIYVAYKYNTTDQRVQGLTYDGSNWISRQTLSFLKVKGVWLPDPTVTIIEGIGVNDDYKWLNDPNNPIGLAIGTATARANLASFGDYNINATGPTVWNDADLTASLAAILLHRFPTPVVGVPYKIVYSVFVSKVTQTSKVFIFNGTAFVLQQ
ncbi:MAG: hypothetical protein ABIN91_17505 [Mucilaginibacter sp.]|uniref:hypothetical protein n=1 Tax=Mucilaginibacter sp. TaxID=1882438 RepID=UPI003264E281